MRGRHLRDQQMIEHILGESLDARALEHLGTCARCSDEARGLSQMVESLRGDQVPDPGPLFWAGFPRRVRDQARKDAAPAPGAGFLRRSLVLAGGLAAMLAIATVSSVVERSRDGIGSDGRTSAPVGAEEWTPLPAHQADEAFQFIEVIAAADAWEEEESCSLGDCLADLNEAEARVVREWLEREVGRES